MTFNFEELVVILKAILKDDRYFLGLSANKNGREYTAEDIIFRRRLLQVYREFPKIRNELQSIIRKLSSEASKKRGDSKK